MSRREDAITLSQMLDHAQEAVKMLRDRPQSDLDADRRLELSLTRLVEIVGEATRRISETGRAQHPDLPWRQIIGMRDRLVHGYDGVDLSILWEVVRHDCAS